MDPEDTITKVEEPTDYQMEELLEWPLEDLEKLDAVKLTNSTAHMVALFLERLKIDERRIVLRLLDESHASDILAEMDPDASAEVIGAMREWRALKILEDLEPDDAADMVAEMEEEDRNRLLGKVRPETAQIVRNLLTYDENTAGGIMNPQVAAVAANNTVDEAIQYIRTHYQETKSVHYIYVTDADQKLVGVLSMRNLILAKSGQKIQEITQSEMKGVLNPSDDKEKVALLMADLNLVSLPVVDSNERLLGIVTHDDVIDILQEEATEDIQKLVGAGPDESIHDPLYYSITRRSPWLTVNLITAFASSGVIYFFQNHIQQITMLAVLMPIIASLGGNTGSQTLAIVIRSLALGEIHDQDNMRIYMYESAKGVINGAIVGFIAASLVYLGTNEVMISIVFFIATILNMGIAGLAGAFVPLLLKKMNFDPAQSASIFLTAITDWVGFLIFLSLGAWLLL